MNPKLLPGALFRTRKRAEIGMVIGTQNIIEREQGAMRGRDVILIWRFNRVIDLKTNEFTEMGILLEEIT